MLKKIISSMALCLVLSGASNQLQARVQARTRIASSSNIMTTGNFVARPMVQPSAPMAQSPVVQESAIKEKEECADCKKWAKALAVREKQLKEKKSTNWFSYLLPFILGLVGGSVNQRFNTLTTPALCGIPALPLRIP